MASICQTVRPDDFSGNLSSLGDHYQSATSLAITVSSIYGFNVALGMGCINFLLRSKDTISRRRLTLLSIYTVGMIALASQDVAAVDSQLYAPVKTVWEGFADPSAQIPVSLPLAVCGADILLIYRCIILYKFVSFRKKVALYIFLALAALISLASAILGFCIRSDFDSGLNVIALTVVAVATIFVNTSVALLIAGRLIYAHRLALRSLSADKKAKPPPYLVALAICIESSVLIIVAASVSIIAVRDMLQVVPQISVMAPLLIVYRVAQGRVETVAKLEATLAFHHTQSSGLSLAHSVVEDYEGRTQAQT